MSEPIQTVPDFLRTKVAGRFRDMVSKAEQKLAQAQREVDDLHSAQGSIGWEIGDDTRYFINIADGDMTIAEEPIHEPFITVVMSAPDWARFVDAAIASGVLANNDRQLGRSRIERVRAIKGSMRFVLTGLSQGGDLTVTLHFGGERMPEPKTIIQVPADIVAKIQGGGLNPQAAFMQGQMKLIGDMGFAMQLGMALAL